MTSEMRIPDPCACPASSLPAAGGPASCLGSKAAAARQARRRTKGSADPAAAAPTTTAFGPDNSGKTGRQPAYNSWPAAARSARWHAPPPTELGLVGAGLGAPCVAALVAGLLGAAGPCLLTTLDLGGNPALGDGGAAALVPLLRAAPHLATLGLSAAGLTARAPLAALLAAGAALRHLHLAGNRRLGDAGLAALCGASDPGASDPASIMPPPVLLLRTLDLADTGVTAAAAATWPRFWDVFGAGLTSLALAHNPGAWPGAGCHRATALRHLALDACALGPADGDPSGADPPGAPPGASPGPLADLGRLGALEHLTLADNAGLGDAGAAALALALRPNARLGALDLARTGLGPAAGRALAFVLATHPGLRRLDVQGNAAFGDAGVAALAGGLRACRAPPHSALEALHLGHTALTPAGRPQLAALLRDALPACGRLDVSGTRAGGAALAALLMCCDNIGGRPGLRVLRLAQCAWGGDAGAALIADGSPLELVLDVCAAGLVSAAPLVYSADGAGCVEILKARVRPLHKLRAPCNLRQFLHRRACLHAEAVAPLGALAHSVAERVLVVVD